MILEITPDNLLDKIDLIGPWSSCSLGETAIMHYHPECREGGAHYDDIGYMATLHCDGKVPTYWSDWIRKYHTEIGYTANELNMEAVNEY